MARDHLVSFRLTSSEEAELRARASRARMSLSDFVRREALAREVAPPGEAVFWNVPPGAVADGATLWI